MSQVLIAAQFIRWGGSGSDKEVRGLTDSQRCSLMEKLGRARQYGYYTGDSDDDSLECTVFNLFPEHQFKGEIVATASEFLKILEARLAEIADSFDGVEPVIFLRGVDVPPINMSTLNTEPVE